MPLLSLQPKIYPYSLTSISAKTLSQQLGGLRIRQLGQYSPKRNHIIINWGNSHYPSWNNRIQSPLINCTTSVQIACNKLLTFIKLKEANVPTPEWTTVIEQAQHWFNERHTVFARTRLSGHSGQGIHVFKPEEHYNIHISAPLYTKYTKCKYEYRVHVMNGQIIDFVMKKKRSGIESNPYIRSHAHGWVFTREHIELPACVKTASLEAINALGLDFGAVDIGYRERDNTCFVYEINTAPALEGTTLSRYVQAFKENYLNNTTLE